MDKQARELMLDLKSVITLSKVPLASSQQASRKNIIIFFLSRKRQEVGK